MSYVDSEMGAAHTQVEERLGDRSTLRMRAVNDCVAALDAFDARLVCSRQRAKPPLLPAIDCQMDEMNS